MRQVLEWDALIDAMETALADFSAGKVLQPVRTMLAIEDGKRYLGVMPAAAAGVMGAKLVTYYPVNANAGIPTHHATIVLFRSDTGEPLATLDGRLITEMRTAAVSAAVTKYLMPAGSRVLAVLGSGVQAGAHVEALRRISKFDDIRVWSRNPDHASAFAAKYGAESTDAQTAVRDADVIVVATSSDKSVLKGAWLKRGAHVNAVGAVNPQWRELDDDAMSNTVVVDSREAALKESGDIILSGARIHAEVGELFSGKMHVPRTDTTVFKSVGVAAEDIAAARIVYEKTVRK